MEKIIQNNDYHNFLQMVSDDKRNISLAHTKREIFVSLDNSITAVFDKDTYKFKYFAVKSS